MVLCNSVICYEFTEQRYKKYVDLCYKMPQITTKCTTLLAKEGRNV